MDIIITIDDGWKDALEYWNETHEMTMEEWVATIVEGNLSEQNMVQKIAEINEQTPIEVAATIAYKEKTEEIISTKLSVAEKIIAEPVVEEEITIEK